MTEALLDPRPPQRIVVTGAAGFIGSHTCELLIDDYGCSITGIDSFTDYYSPELKRSNVSDLRIRPEFELVNASISPELCRWAFRDADVVIHLAAQPGVRMSWDDFDTYVERNITATKTVLDAALECGVERVVYASSSSVYGVPTELPTHERALPSPRSPYGVTKMTAEQLVNAFSAERGLPTVSLRYFTVYGPRQRPDMATHRLVNAAFDGTAFPLYGDGSQVRDFTYVGDIARANALAAIKPGLAPGLVLNVCGGAPVRLTELIETVEALTGRSIDLDRRPRARGDVPTTAGQRRAIEQHLGWSPQTPLRDGLMAQIEHQSRDDIRRILSVPVPTS